MTFIFPANGKNGTSSVGRLALVHGICESESIPSGNCRVNPTSKSPQATGTSERKGLIADYLKKIGILNSSDPSSLQHAINMTDALLKDLKTTNGEMNILIATKELETFINSYAKRQLTPTNHTIMERRDDFVVFMRTIPLRTKDVAFSVTGEFNSTTDTLNRNDVQIRLPASLFHKQSAYMTTILYNKIDQHLPSQAQASLDGITIKNGYIGSRVISITVDHSTEPFDDSISITFSHFKSISSPSKPNCVFWNFSMQSPHNGSWSNKGCRVVNYTSSRTHCSCDHLTHFAVLMQVKDQKVSAKHQVALELITYIGCAISLIGESITVVAYVVFLNLKTHDTQIRFNLVISIAAAQLVFILGIDATQIKTACIVAAAAMHYFFLVAFCWMFIEALALYLNVVKVFNTHFKMWPVYGFSWGFPLIIVFVSLLIASISTKGIQSYISGNFCWISYSNGLVWSFVVPILVMSTLNFLILARVIREVSVMPATNSSEKNKFKRVLKACLVLLPLLGVTWVLGVFSVTEPIGLACQYLFTICNSLQGFFIFVLHVVRSSEFRANVKRKFQRWESKRNPNVAPALAPPTNASCEPHLHSSASREVDDGFLKTASQRL
ncbi:hypothetical protein ACROYT_G011043 [Oculina patagonica]